MCFRHEQEKVGGNENEGLCLYWSCVIFVVFLIPSKQQEGSMMISLINLILEMRNLRSKKEAQFGKRAYLHTCVIFQGISLL